MSIALNPFKTAFTTREVVFSFFLCPGSGSDFELVKQPYQAVPYIIFLLSDIKIAIR